MAKVTIPYLKTRFESGDRPNGEDYVNLIDTLAANSTDLGSAGNNEQVINGIENTTVIDSFLSNEWRTIKYLISISKTSEGANKFYATELTILIDGNNINITEYGIIDNDGDIGTINVSRDGNTVEIIVVPNSAITPITIRFYRTGLKA